MTQKHIVKEGLSLEAAVAVAGYHNDLFHNSQQVAHCEAAVHTFKGTFLVWCEFCPAESPVDTETIRLFARAGYAMHQRARWYWSFSCEPDFESIDEWRTNDGGIFLEYGSSIDSPPSQFRYGLDYVKGFLEDKALPVQCYRILALDDGDPPTELTDEVVIEAPSPGMALECFLAARGMLSYDQMWLEETDQEPDETIMDLAHIVRIPITQELCDGYDTHHKWKAWPKESF